MAIGEMKNKPRLRRTAAVHAADRLELPRKVLSEAAALAAARRQRSASGNLPKGTAERWVLERLAAIDSALTVPALARERGISRQSVQIIVDRLLNRGYLVMMPNPAHRRSPILALTEAGHQASWEVRGQEAAVLAAVASAVTPIELEAALRVLRLLRAETGQ